MLAPSVCCTTAGLVQAPPFTIAMTSLGVEVRVTEDTILAQQVKVWTCVCVRVFVTELGWWFAKL